MYSLDTPTNYSTRPYVRTSTSVKTLASAAQLQAGTAQLQAGVAQLQSSMAQLQALSSTPLVRFQLFCFCAHIMNINEPHHFFCRCSGPVIARTGTATCPVAMLERYITAAQISSSSKLHLFRAITSTKHGERLRPSGSLSYTRMRELLLAKLEQIGYDKSQFGLHSLRAGGATAAANAGVPEKSQSVTTRSLVLYMYPMNV